MSVYNNLKKIRELAEASQLLAPGLVSPLSKVVHSMTSISCEGEEESVMNLAECAIRAIKASNDLSMVMQGMTPLQEEILVQKEWGLDGVWNWRVSITAVRQCDGKTDN